MTHYTDVLLPFGPELYWPMQESSGDIHDLIHDKAMGPHGDRDLRQPSEYGLGYSIRFNAGSYEGTTNFLAFSNVFTILCWFSYPNSSSSIQTLLHRRNSFRIWSLNNQVTADIVLSDGSVHSVGLNYSSYFNDGKQHLLGVTGAIGTLSIYLDGNIIGNPLSTARNIKWPTDRGMFFGQEYRLENDSPYNYWKGKLNHVAFFNNKLNEPDFQKIYAAGIRPSVQMAAGTMVSRTFSSGQAAHEHKTFSKNVSIGPARMFMDFDLVHIFRPQPWWDHDYPYRRRLYFKASPKGLRAGHPLYANISRDIIDQGKTREDLADVSANYLEKDLPEVWDELQIETAVDSEFLTTKFASWIDMDPGEESDGQYYIYYGNKDLFGVIPTFETVPDEWYVKLTPSSPELDYTTPGKHWNNGIAAIKLAKMALHFYGDRIRVWSKMGPHQGIMEVQINDGDWEKMDLYAPNDQEPSVIYLIRDLPLEGNYLRLRVSGESNPLALGVGVNFTRVDYGQYSTMIDMGEEADETQLWGSAIGGMSSG